MPLAVLGITVVDSDRWHSSGLLGTVFPSSRPVLGDCPLPIHSRR